MTAHLSELILRPTPILEHDARHFEEIRGHPMSMETYRQRPRYEVVHALSQFVEEGRHLTVLQQSTIRGCGTRKVAHEKSGRIHSAAILFNIATLKIDILRTFILVRSPQQVHER